MISKDFPRCIYFDTNIIRRIRLTDPGVSFLELRNWTEESKTPVIIPKLVWMEWFNDFYENIKKKADQTKKNLRDFEILLGLKPEKFELPDDYIKMLVKTLQDKLKEMGIQISDTPKNISLEELVAMAAFKIRPFEEKNEKGFRDTIILYTILEDMKSRKVKNSLFVTDDSVFTHKDVLEIVKKYGVSLEIVSSVEEASIHIKNVLDDRVKRFIELKKQKLLDFVKTKSVDIFSFIKEKSTLTEDFITKGGFLSTKQEIFGEIERVLEFEPVEIESAFDTIRIGSEKFLPKNTEPILISVKTHLKIEYLPLLLFNRPGVKVQDLNKFKEVVRSTIPQYYGQATETDLTRSLTISALAMKNDKGEYVDLKLERVNTL